MTCLALTSPDSGRLLALLTLPEPLTATNLHELEDATAQTLASLGRCLFGTGPVPAAGHGAIPAYDTEAEYASWIPDPVAAELAAWASRHRRQHQAPAR